MALPMPASSRPAGVSTAILPIVLLAGRTVAEQVECAAWAQSGECTKKCAASTAAEAKKRRSENNPQKLSKAFRARRDHSPDFMNNHCQKACTSAGPRQRRRRERWHRRHATRAACAPPPRRAAQRALAA